MTLLIMALIGNVIADAFAGNPSIINYVIFVSVFAMLSLFYLIAAAIMDGFAIPLAMVVLDALNTLLFLVGGIALAAYLGVHSCGNRVCLTCRSFPRQPMFADQDTVLCRAQQDHKWLAQPNQEVSRRAGGVRIFVVWLCRMGWLADFVGAFIAWRNKWSSPR